MFNRVHISLTMVSWDEGSSKFYGQWIAGKNQMGNEWSGKHERTHQVIYLVARLGSIILHSLVVDDNLSMAWDERNIRAVVTRSTAYR